MVKYKRRPNGSGTVVKLSGRRRKPFCAKVTLDERNLTNGDIAIGLFNLGEEKAVARFNLDELGLPLSTGKTLHMTDIWTGKRADTANATVFWDLEPYDCAVFRAKVVDIK